MGTARRVNRVRGPTHASIAKSRCAGPKSSLLKRRVEGPAAGGKILAPHEAAGLAGAEFSLHATVFPFDGERPVIFGHVQGADDLLEVHAAAAGAAEIPPATRIAKVDVARQNAAFAV